MASDLREELRVIDEKIIALAKEMRELKWKWWNTIHSQAPATTLGSVLGEK